MKLLLVATDVRLAALVRAGMGRGGSTGHWVVSGDEAAAALQQDVYNCAVFALGEPAGRAGEVLLQLRRINDELPVLVVTVSSNVDERIALLDLGADGLLVKPVHLDELMAHLRALLRRCIGKSRYEPTLLHGSLLVVPAARTVTHNGSFVALTPKEFELLEALLRSKGQVLSRRRLEQAMQGAHAAGNPVEVHIHHLRRKLGRGIIRTVRGAGYTIGPETWVDARRSPAPSGFAPKRRLRAGGDA
jgi:DNA-binding response OmpR family regulator